MKKMLLFIALTVSMAVSVSAQGRFDYDPTFKYGPFSNCEITATVHYAFQHASNVGVDVIVEKYLDEDWNLRLVGGINGLVPVRGFDRYGFALVGLSYEFVPWLYGYLDAGASVNPSMKTVLGFAADAGVGAQYVLGTRWKLLTELGCNFAENHTTWLYTPICKVGAAFKLGCTEKDRIRHDIYKYQLNH